MADWVSQPLRMLHDEADAGGMAIDPPLPFLARRAFLARLEWRT
jgi:hypothetical protein